MTRQELLNVIEECKKNKWDLCISVTIPGQDTLEYIVNKNSSIDNKVKYYNDMYNDDLEHRMNHAVKIVKAFGMDFYDGE